MKRKLQKKNNFTELVKKGLRNSFFKLIKHEWTTGKKSQAYEYVEHGVWLYPNYPWFKSLQKSFESETESLWKLHYPEIEERIAASDAVKMDYLQKIRFLEMLGYIKNEKKPKGIRKFKKTSR